MARLFEQTAETTPDTTQRLAYGKASVATKNITIANFLIWLQDTALKFLKPSNNLSDLEDKEVARTNLGVYSSDEVDDKIDAGGTSTGWLSGTVSSTYQDTDEAYIKAKRTGAFVTITGILYYLADVDPTGKTVFSLPSGILKPSENILFVAKSGGSTDEQSWLEVSSTDLTIIGTTFDTRGDKYARDSHQAFCITYPVVTT